MKYQTIVLKHFFGLKGADYYVRVIGLKRGVMWFIPPEKNKGIRAYVKIRSHSNGDIFTCEDIKFSRESSLGISLVFI